MNNNTDRILYQVSKDTESLSIVNDDSLTQADMEAIAGKINSCPNLRSLTLSHCGLSSNKMQWIAGAVAEHKTLSSLNFSGNSFRDLDFLRMMIAGNGEIPGNPHIREIDITGCEKDGEEGKWRSWANFFKSAMEHDNLVSLKIDDDPWNYYSAGFNILKNPDDKVINTVNLIDFPLEKWSPTYATDSNSRRYVSRKAEVKRDWMAEHCKKNREDAERLLDRVKEAHIITASDVEDVNKRLPLIIYLSENAIGREPTFDLLRGFFDRAQATPGLLVNMDYFRNYVPKRKVSPQAQAMISMSAPQETVPKTYSISEILATLPPFDEAKTRQQIEDCIAHPSGLQNLGRPEITAAISITRASVHIMESMPTTEKVETAMKGFLGKFQEAIVFTESLMNKTICQKLRQISDPLLPKWPQRHESQSGFLSHIGLGHKDSIADVAALMTEANSFLADAHREIGTLGTDITSQIESTESASDAYIIVEQQIEKITTLGSLVVEEKRKSLVDNKVPDIIAGKTSAHLNQLQEHLNFLNTGMGRIKETDSPYIVHASMVQTHSQRISELAEQHFPLLIEEVNILIGHLQSSVPSNDQSASQALRNANTQAAQQVFETIGGVVADMLTLFRAADDGATAIRGHIDKLLPTKAPTKITEPVIAAAPTRPQLAVTNRFLPDHEPKTP